MNNGPGSGLNPPEESYANDRNSSWTYDADGRVTDSTDIQYTFDAAGRTIRAQAADSDQQMMFDGDGQRVRMLASTTGDDGSGNTVTVTTTRYEIRSSVIADVITEVDENGQKARGFVYSGGSVLAVQTKQGTVEAVEWQHSDASNASYRVTNSSGAVVTDRSGETDPLGRDAGTRSPYNFPRPHRTGVDYTYPGFMDAVSGYCGIDGIPAPCSMASRMRANGSGVAKHVRMRFRNPATGEIRYAPATWTVTRYGIGYVADGAKWDGSLWMVNLGENQFGNMYGGHNGVYVPDNLSLSSPEHGAQSTGVRKALSTQDQEHYKKERDKLIRNGISQACADWLNDKLKSLGLSANDVLKAIESQQPFDGNESTLSIGEAGVRDLGEEPSPPDLNEPVYKAFRSGANSAETTLYPNGRLGTLQERSIVYFQHSRGTLFGRDWGGLTAKVIFHEAIHTVTGLGDVRLAKQLGLSYSTEEGPSQAINRALKDHGCVK